MIYFLKDIIIKYWVYNASVWNEDVNMINYSGRLRLLALGPRLVLIKRMGNIYIFGFGALNGGGPISYTVWAKGQTAPILNHHPFSIIPWKGPAEYLY